MFNGIQNVVIGAGITGLTVARCMAERLNQKVLIIEKRNHIGGNCHDAIDEQSGLRIHRYGPHIFHTKHAHVWNFLSRFTEWSLYQHRVLTYVDGQLLPLPICTTTINRLFGLSLSGDQVTAFLDERREKDRPIQNSEDVVLAAAGREIYEKFFLHYTKKQWDMYPSELSPSVIARVPVRTTGDDRYFTDPYQGMPRHGYARMFREMANHPNVKLLLQTDYREVLPSLAPQRIVCTAPVDEFFDFRLGALQYRSLRIEFKTHAVESFQPAAVVNYPNDYDFTRITEYKKLTGQSGQNTVISMEYPTWQGERYYPVPDASQQKLYTQYADLAKQTRPDVLFLGRLGEYRYYNMDTAVDAALCACAAMME